MENRQVGPDGDWVVIERRQHARDSVLFSRSHPHTPICLTMHASGLFAHRFPRHLIAALSLVFAILLPACDTLIPGQPAMQAAPAPSDAAGSRALNEQQAAEIRALNETNAKLQLKLLERNAELTRLDDERNEAIQEVVRTKSKLRSIESKAEAASTMAEVEVALKQVKAAAAKANQDPGPGIHKAEQLLAMSATEFEGNNYGGTIYLATQAKSLIGTRREQMGAHNLSPQLDEIPFAFPIALKSLRRSNVRDGPGLAFEVLLTLPRETPMLGLAYKDQWVRVRVEDGRDGWMHYTLVDNQHSDRR